VAATRSRRGKGGKGKKLGGGVSARGKGIKREKNEPRPNAAGARGMVREEKGGGPPRADRAEIRGRRGKTGPAPWLSLRSHLRRSEKGREGKGHCGPCFLLPCCFPLGRGGGGKKKEGEGAPFHAFTVATSPGPPEGGGGGSASVIYLSSSS